MRTLSSATLCLCCGGPSLVPAASMPDAAFPVYAGAYAWLWCDSPYRDYNTVAKHTIRPTDANEPAVRAKLRDSVTSTDASNRLGTHPRNHPTTTGSVGA